MHYVTHQLSFPWPWYSRENLTWQIRCQLFLYNWWWTLEAGNHQQHSVLWTGQAAATASNRSHILPILPVRFTTLFHV